MKEINWHNFKPSDTVHISEIKELKVIAYNTKTAKISSVFCDPSPDIDVAFWAEFILIGSGCWKSLIRIAFNDEAYCYGWKDKRLSSTAEHRYLFRQKLWLTIGDRDYLFNSLRLI